MPVTKRPSTFEPAAIFRRRTRDAVHQAPLAKAKPKRESMAERIYRERREATESVASGKTKISAAKSTRPDHPPTRRPKSLQALAAARYGSGAGASGGELIPSGRRGGPGR